MNTSKLAVTLILLCIISPSFAQAPKGADVCGPCLGFMQSNLETMVKIVSGLGAFGTCTQLCVNFNSTLAEEETCMNLCTYVGYETFWQLFERSNLDPFWACQLLTACPVQPNPAANLNWVEITPKQAPAGSLFEFIVPFTVINETGIGQLAYAVYYPSGNQKFVNTTSFEDYAVGDYKVQLSFQTNTTFDTGNYAVIFNLCAGMCGGRSPNSQTLDELQAFFAVVAN
jgi:hypothetical protein